jgi:hypothetical protein
MKAFQLIVGVAIFFVFASSARAAEFLSPDEIKTTFATGVAFTATSASGETKRITLNPDGTATITSKAEKKKSASKSGKWRLSADGYCSTWGKGSENCYLIKPNGKKFDVLTAKKEVIAHWSK